MAIRVKCDCGHELSVADKMAGKKGRCPECGEVISIPGSGRAGRGGAYSRISREAGSQGYAWLRGLAWLMMILAFGSLLLFIGIGVYTGVTAIQSPDPFRGPFGLFSGLADTVRQHGDLMGGVFILGGIVSGCLSFLMLAAVGQAFRLFISLEHSLKELSGRMGGR